MQCGCQNWQRPSEPKADAKHQGLAMALDDLQSKKKIGDHWSLFAEAHGHVKGGKHRAGVDQKINEKSQGILVTFSYFFWNRSRVSLWRKQHFFQNAHNRWRGFPPDGKFLYPIFVSTLPTF